MHFFCYRLADAHKISIEKSKYLGGWLCDANAILLLEGNDFPFYGELACLFVTSIFFMVFDMYEEVGIPVLELSES